MEKTGQLIWKSEVETGVSKAGKSFSKMSFAIQEKNVKFENKVAFETLSSELIQMISDTTLNSEITVFFDVKSREYSGKWYTSATAFKAEVVKNDWNMVTEQSDFNRSNNQRAAQAMKDNPQYRNREYNSPASVVDDTAGSSDDLPFPIGETDAPNGKKDIVLTPKDVLKEFSERDNFNMIVERFKLELV